MILNLLVIWETQYGDFGNDVQCIIDTFISSSKVKELIQDLRFSRSSGLLHTMMW